MTITRRGLVGAAALAWAAGGPVLAQTQSGGRPRWKITMAGTSGGLLQWFPVYVARGMKYFEQEGIDLDWVDLNSGTAMVAAVIGGSTQMAPLGMEHMVLSEKEGGDMMVFSALFDVYPHSLVLTKAAMAKNGIAIAQTVDEKISRLKGLTIGIAGAGGSTDVMLRNLLHLRRMDPDQDIQIQPVGAPPAMLAALSKGIVDGVLQSAPVDMVAEAKGYGTIVLDAFTDDIPELRNVPFAGMLARRAYIQQSPDVILAAARAIARAIKFAKEQPEETVRAVRPFVVGDDPAVVTRMIERYRGGQAKTPVISKAQFEGTLRWVNLSESKPLTVRMDDVVYNQAALAAEKEILGKG